MGANGFKGYVAQLSFIKAKEIEMDYKRLADVIRQFDNIELLANEIETLEDVQDVETIGELSDFLYDELDYSNQ